MSTSPSDGSKPKSTGMGQFLKQAIAAEHARSHVLADATLELPRCANCGAAREEETLPTGGTLRCHYCGSAL